MELCRKFRAAQRQPDPAFPPDQQRTEILEAYQNGVDECVIKPISPAIFLAKIIAWSRRSWSEPMTPASNRAVCGSTRPIVLQPAPKKRDQTYQPRIPPAASVDEPPRLRLPRRGDHPNRVGRAGRYVLLKNLVYRLRKKMEEEAGEDHLIKTWPGGYSFVDD
jgi:DNA-binding response OmpR family regulator